MKKIFLIDEESENNGRIKKRRKRMCVRKEGNYDKNAEVNTATQYNDIYLSGKKNIYILMAFSLGRGSGLICTDIGVIRSTRKRKLPDFK